MLNLKSVNIKYGKTKVVEDFSYEFKEGTITAIIGPNGAGKSTLSKAIAKTIPFTGEVLFQDTPVKSLKRKEIAKIIGFLTQSQNVYFPFTVFDTVMVGRYAHAKDNLNTKSIGDTDLVNNALKRVGMYDYKDKFISELSGGQKQRVYLARLMVQDTKIAILDEPTNNLDFKYQIELLEFVEKWAKEDKKIVIIVMHDINLVKRYADNVILMTPSKEYIIGNKDEVLSKENLKNTFGIDIESHMKKILELWK